jgi:hypothetical protein
MKESIKMEEYDGFLGKFTKQHKTKILPLRWFANSCEIFGHYHLIKAIRLDEAGDWGFTNKYHSFMSELFYKPYYKWGTVYELDTYYTEKLKNDPVVKMLGSDYDENNIPYWKKYEERLKYMEENGI